MKLDDRLIVAPDTGCDLHPACLSCPEEVCIEDTTASDRYLARNGDRDARILRFRRAGMPQASVARWCGVSATTVRRVLRRYGEA